MNSKRYKIVEINFNTGERMPVIIERNGFVPFLPICYSMIICRPQNFQSTILIKMNAIKFFYEWGNICKIDIEERFKNGKMLNLTEIDSLVYATRLELNDFVNYYQYPNNQRKKENKIKKLKLKTVSYANQSSRLVNISQYLEWMSFECLKKIKRKSSEYKERQENMKNILSLLKFRTPRRIAKTYSKNKPPKGFSTEIQTKILQTIEPSNPKNPWKNKFVQIRNQLYVSMALATGIRLGESLAIKMQDLKRSGDQPSIQIVRRPDDSEDDRTPPARVKTSGREIRIGQTWYPLLLLYINKYRNRLKKARQHKYLFVARNGNKLSYSTAKKIFKKLSKINGIPDSITQHMIRHAWNERFSEAGEAKKVAQEQIEESRRYLMAWSESSNMPKKYNERYTEKKANEISLEMQQKIFKKRQ